MACFPAPCRPETHRVTCSAVCPGVSDASGACNQYSIRTRFTSVDLGMIPVCRLGLDSRDLLCFPRSAQAKVYDSPPPLSLMGFAVYPKDCGPACACVPANEASRHLRTIPLPEDTTKSAARQAIAQIITGYTEDM